MADATLDRRLRPIYEAIDSRNYKAAAKLATTAISKHGDHPLFKTLKALALERSGKKDEALELCTQVRESNPTDETVLNTLQIVYKNLGRTDEATKCYEAFASRDPNNPDSMVVLFNAYVREYNYVKQQQVALKLYKLLGDEHYLLWAVCSLQLQNNSSALPLAEALLRKRLDSQGLKELESLLVFLAVLEKQQKQEQALEAISGPLGSLFSMPADRWRIQGDLQMKLGKYDSAHQTYTNLLRHSPDDWLALQGYLDASFEGSAEDFEQILANAKSFLTELQNCVEESGQLCRGPYLGEVELAKRVLERRRKAQEPDSQQAERALAEAIVNYFRKFAHMISFPVDVKLYVLSLESNSGKAWLAQALHAVEASEAEESATRALRRQVAAYQVEEQLGLPAGEDNPGLLERGLALARLYCSTRGSFASIEKRERGFSEELLVMATNCLLEIYRRTHSLGFLLEAVLMLEQGLADRRFNSTYKLMICNLYFLMGAPGPAMQWFSSLETKHIQLETLSHHVLPSLLALGDVQAAAKLMSDLHRFHDNNTKEAADLTLLAYRHNTFSKVVEFVEFKERLEKSYQRLASRAEMTLQMLADNAGALTEAQAVLAAEESGRRGLQQAEEATLQALTFNADLATRPWWTREPDRNLLLEGTSELSWHEPLPQEARQAWEHRSLRTLERRCLLPRLLALASGPSPPTSSAPKAKPQTSNGAAEPEGGPKPSEELGSLLGRYVKTFGEEEGSLEVLEEVGVAMFRVAREVLLLQEGGDAQKGALAARVLEVTGGLQKGVQSALAHCFVPLVDLPGDEGVLVTVAPNAQLTRLAHLVLELSAWLVLCLQSWARAVNPPLPKRKKKGGTEAGKAPEAQLFEDGRESLRGLISVTSSLLSRVVTTIASHLSMLEPQVVTAYLTRLPGWQSKSNREGEESLQPGRVLAAIRDWSSLDAEVATAKEERAEARDDSKDDVVGPMVPQAIVLELVRSQRAVLTHIKNVAQVRLSSLSKLSL